MTIHRRTAISQKEARRLGDRVRDLEDVLRRQRHAWAAEWPEGVNITTQVFDTEQHPTMVAVHTARRLGHAVVAVTNGNRLALIALPLGDHNG